MTEELFSEEMTEHMRSITDEVVVAKKETTAILARLYNETIPQMAKEYLGVKPAI